MSEPTGHVCPECAAPRVPDGTPSCPCGPRVSEALKDARTAEAAAAEDFDPLRIRPYIELAADEDSVRTNQPPGDVPAVALPAALNAPEPDRPAADEAPAPDRRPRSGRRTLLIVAGSAAAALAAVVTVGVLSYDAPERKGALPDDLRAGVPGTSVNGGAEPSASAGTASTGPSAPVSGSAPPSGSGREASPSASGGTASAPPSASATRPAPSASAGTSGGPAGAPDDDPGDDGPAVAPAPVLRLGDKGPAVTELQQRLDEAGFYLGEADGAYDRELQAAVARYQLVRLIPDDRSGEYGPRTRERLESETEEP